VTPAASSVALRTPYAANPVAAAGDGEPVVYLHGLLGPEWPGFLDDLAAERRVLAPVSPGIADASDLRHMDGFADLVLYYDDLFDELDLGRVDVVGHCFGGMVAAEYAATMRDRVRRLVLIDPLGLWLDDAPVEDHLLAPEERRTELLFHDRDAPEVRRRLRGAPDAEQARKRLLATFDALAATAHFIHPIPERGLHRRLPRITARTLVVWGDQDALAASAYADAFAGAIPDAELARISGAGHHPHLERREDTSGVVTAFLADA
jgi:pimeloyl-ACP methyl ester carboxylesterase